MALRSTELRYAVRTSVLTKHFGYLCLMQGVLTVVPFGYVLFAGEAHTALRLGIVAAVLSICGALLSRMPERHRIQPNEAMVLGCLMFVFSPLIMTFPLTATGLDFVDAYFEAVSGVTTTGLSMVGNLENAPPALLFSRSWMQWYGGLGIVVFSVALVIRPGISAKDLSLPEVREEGLVGGTRHLYRQILILYASLTVGAVALFLAAGLGPFQAVTFAFSAVSTGGFAPREGSLAGLGWSVPLAVTLITVLCAVPLTRYLGVRLKGWGVLFGSVQLWGLLALGFLSALVLFLLTRQAGAEWSGQPLNSLVMAFSAQTTSGFSSIDKSVLPHPAKGWLIFTMFIGGGLGSTAGGFKILRLLIFFKVISIIVNRASLSRHAVYRPSIRNEPLREPEMRDALAVIIMYLSIAIFSWIPFLLYGYDPLDALFDVVSALGTVGLSAGVAGPELPVLLKGVLCADMLLGRLEIMVWLVLFYPGTWVGRHSEE
jgi:trk system potassium uptake protein